MPAVRPHFHLCLVTGGQFRLREMPTADSVLVEKDILRVGRWHLSSGRGNAAPWDVTPETLRMIVTNFYRMKRAGNRVPLIWEHDGGPQERLGDVADVFVKDGTLYGRCEITDKKHLSAFGAVPGSETPHEVSVEVSENWRDGTGNEYDLALTHLAIVINPVVTHQGPFRRLSLSGAKHMAKDSGDDQDISTWTLDEVKELLGKFGVSIPDSATTKEAVIAVADAMSGAGAEPEPDSADAEMPMAIDAMKPEEMTPAQRSLALMRARKRLSLFQNQQAAAAEAAFVGELERMIEAGDVKPGERDGLLADGKACQFRLSLLTRLRGRAVVPTGGRRVASLGATGTAPSGQSAEDELKRQEDVQKRVLSIMGFSS